MEVHKNVRCGRILLPVSTKTTAVFQRLSYVSLCKISAKSEPQNLARGDPGLPVMKRYKFIDSPINDIFAKTLVDEVFVQTNSPSYFVVYS